MVHLLTVATDSVWNDSLHGSLDNTVSAHAAFTHVSWDDASHKEDLGEKDG